MAKMKRQAVPIPGTNKVAGGLRYRIIVWVQTGSRNARDRWHRLCSKLGVHWTLASANPEPSEWEDERGNKVPAQLDHGFATVEDANGKPIAAWESPYECWGKPEALSELTCGLHKAVIRMHNVVEAGHNATTTIGPEKRSHTPKKKHRSKSSGVFRWYDREHLATHREAYRKQLIAGCCGLDPSK